MKVSALALLPLAGLASADVPAWGQCGGESYTGSTTCISGWTCVYSDPWWSQCLPSSSSSSWTTTTTTTTSSASSTASVVAAYGQCGGQGYTGPTDCVAGYTCSISNQWYSQCVPGSASSSSSTSTTVSSSTTTSSSITTSSSTTTSSGSPSATGFAGRSGLNFTIGGRPGYFAGTNSYWIGFLTNNNDVDTVFDHMKQSGIKILRVWGFNDVNTQPSSGTVYFQLLSNGQATINTGPDGLQRLDYVVAAAEARGIKLIINFVNYWNDYGGMNAYINGFASGADVTIWYTNSAIQSAYRAYIKAVVSRYINSDAIFAWELANEPRCRGCATSVITSWVQSTSAYIKSLDSKHMVCVGDEGMGITTGSDSSYPYTTYEGVAFNDLIAIDTIDFGTIHLYPSQWGVSNSWGNTWITNHGAACAAAGKPCLFEEYGVTSDKCNVEGQWQTTALGATGISADLFWQWGDTISSGQTPNDDYTIYDPSSDFTCLVTNHVAAVSSR